MSRFFYTRLAINNIRKNGRTYIPYIFTCIITVMMFYIIKSLSCNPGIESMRGASVLTELLKMGSFIVGFFSVIFLFYTNSFLVKRRKKEFGVFNILGLEKKHLAKVVALETLLVGAIGMSVGIVFGIVLDKIMYLLIANMLEADIALGFYISGYVIRYTLILFSIIFAAIFLKTVNMIRVANPIELLRGGNVGEKEPKTKWLIALIGAISLAAGYYMALTVKDPVQAVTLFFIAVILVIIGTYMLFTAGSIALLKMLKKNKKYYYKTRHFISVSGMIYRMKQNAVGLANICILSTFVLVMISTTTSLMIGMEDMLHKRYPNDFSLYSRDVSDEEVNENISQIKNICAKENLSVINEIEYSYLNIGAIQEGSDFYFDMSSIPASDLMNKAKNLVFSTVDDYNAIMGENINLNAGEVLIWSNREAYGSDTIRIFDKEYKIVKVLDKFYGNGTIAMDILSSHYIIVSDMEELQSLQKCTIEEAGSEEKGDLIRSYYGFDSDSNIAQQRYVYSLINNLDGIDGRLQRVEIKEENRLDFFAIYGGLFFLGVFLSVLFLMATVLIIYYKQISEGYEDKERFNIMQKVGMSQSEVKSAINSQVLTVFFLPLIIAGIHLSVAFPLLSKFMFALNMYNVSLYAICAIICFAVFALIYVIIYSMTAKVYYRIVSVN